MDSLIKVMNEKGDLKSRETIKQAAIQNRKEID